MMPKTRDMPAEMPPNWGVYFAVADTDATVAKAQELGGAVFMGPTDIEPGRFAVLADNRRRRVQRPQAQGLAGMAMERRRLGRTGHESSVAILGGAACWAATVEEAGAWLRLALDRGVNHLDIAPQYGAAESVVGPHLAAHRDELFIAGKTLRANPDGVTDQFDTTRRLLNAEVLDLYQAHAVTSLDELDRRSPALERIVALRDAGPHPLRRHHRARPRSASGPSRGTAALRPRHGHVPGLSRPCGRGPSTASRPRSCWRSAPSATSASW